MRRLAILIFVSVAVVLIFSGFKMTEHRAIEIRNCILSDDEANFQILPGNLYRPDTVCLNVNIVAGADLAAVGSRKIELLQIPSEGITFRVPLSKRLESHKKYCVEVDIESFNCGSARLGWNNIAVTGIGSNGFFERNFRPITEPSDLRNQISIAGIRKKMSR